MHRPPPSPTGAGKNVLRVYCAEKEGKEWEAQNDILYTHSILRHLLKPSNEGGTWGLALGEASAGPQHAELPLIAVLVGGTRVYSEVIFPSFPIPCPSTSSWHVRRLPSQTPLCTLRLSLDGDGRR